MSPEEKLCKALAGSGIVEVVQSSSSQGDVNKIVVQVRVSKEDTPKWLTVVNFILQEEEEQDKDEYEWAAHICKTYVRHEGKLGFIYSVTIVSRMDIKIAVSEISRVIRVLSANIPNINPYSLHNAKDSQIKRAATAVASSNANKNIHNPVVNANGEVEVMPLHGVTSTRNTPDGPGGKGARYIEGRRQ